MATETVQPAGQEGWDVDLHGRMRDAAGLPVDAKVEDYNPKKDPVLSGKVRSLVAPSVGLRLPNALAARGLTVRVLDGYGSRGDGSYFAPRGSVAHWTAGPDFNGDYSANPSLGIVTDGSARGLPNALCNTYGPRDGSVVVVCAGTAWHAGVGGRSGLQFNSQVFGHEMEGSGPGDFTPQQLAAYPKIIAAFHDLIGNDPAEWAWAHSEWAPTRKIDIGAYMPDIRNRAAALWRGETLQEEDDMFTDLDRAMLARLHDRVGPIDSTSYGVGLLLARDPAQVSAADVAAAIPDALAQQVADELAKRLAQ